MPNDDQKEQKYKTNKKSPKEQSFHESNWCRTCKYHLLIYSINIYQGTINEKSCNMTHSCDDPL